MFQSFKYIEIPKDLASQANASEAPTPMGLDDGIPTRDSSLTKSSLARNYSQVYMKLLSESDINKVRD